MDRQIINDAFILQLPDSFEVLTERELRGMYLNAGDPFEWGARDAENHVVILALWKQYPGILSRMLDLKTMVKKNEQLTRKAHQGHDYRLLEFFSLQAGENKAEGYCFSYDREGVAQVSHNFLVRDGRTIYAFICAGRKENMERDRAMIRQVMETLEYA